MRATRDTTESITLGGQAVEHHVRISGQEHFYDAQPSTAAFMEGTDSAQANQRLNLTGDLLQMAFCMTFATAAECKVLRGTTLLQTAACLVTYT